MTGAAWPKPFPALVALDGDLPFRESLAHERMKLQRCGACGRFRYPVAPVCPACLSEESDWTEVCGRATLVSWCTFHRKYLDAFPPPHTVVVAELEEGPFFIAMLLDRAPADGDAGAPLRLTYVSDPEGSILPAFRRDGAAITAPSKAASGCRPAWPAAAPRSER